METADGHTDSHNDEVQVETISLDDPRGRKFFKGIDKRINDIPEVKEPEPVRVTVGPDLSYLTEGDEDASINQTENR